MSSLTSLTPLPFPDPTDQPFIHLDIQALAEATAEALPVVADAKPPHRRGRLWTSPSGRTFRSIDNVWKVVDVVTAGGGTVAGPAIPAGGPCEDVGWTVSATLTAGMNGVYPITWPTSRLSGTILAVSDGSAHLWYPGTVASARLATLTAPTLTGAGLIFTNAAGDILTTGGPFIVSVRARFHIAS